jgi:signal transduction histidine kinase
MSILISFDSSGGSFCGGRPAGFAVSDNGIGIAPEYKEMIFGLF